MQDAYAASGFVMVGAGNEELTNTRQVMRGLWHALGPEGPPPPPPLPSSHPDAPMTEPSVAASSEYAHASMDSSYEAPDSPDYVRWCKRNQG